MTTTESKQPVLMIHGGAGSFSDNKTRNKTIRKRLLEIVDDIYPILSSGRSATEAVKEACIQLENSPLFNAGYGSKLQEDGGIRMSASIMNGLEQRFSGTINIEQLQNPIELAHRLQNRPDRILDSEGSELLAREMSLPRFDPVTRDRLNSWLKKKKQELSKSGNAHSGGGGTIGAVARDQKGNLAAGTSTGGKGFEHIGRVSDSATPAGNYADQYCAISCTGTGEDIVDECFGTRVAVRTKDFGNLESALRRSFLEASQRDRSFGAIAISNRGELWWGKTTERLLGAYRAGQGVKTTLADPLAKIIANPRQTIQIESP